MNSEEKEAIKLSLSCLSFIQVASLLQLSRMKKSEKEAIKLSLSCLSFIQVTRYQAFSFIHETQIL